MDVTSLVRIWDDLLKGRPPNSWWWFCQDAHHGDLYAVCSLVEAFTTQHGRDRPIRLVLGQRSRVPDLFEGSFSEVIYEPNATAGYKIWSDFFETTGIQGFGVDRPIVLAPFSNPELRFGERFAYENGIPWTQLYKSVLRLTADCRPCKPQFSEAAKTEALAFCQVHGVVQATSVVLAPYSQSWPVEDAQKFLPLVDALKKLGYHVFTNCGPTELALDGAPALRAPLHLLPLIAEYAGWFVGLRSGACDVISSAACRKTIVFGPKYQIAQWGFDKMDFCHDAEQIYFQFSSQNSTDIVQAILHDRIPSSPLVQEPITKCVELGKTILLESLYGSLNHHAWLSQKGTLNGDGFAFSEGWWDLEPWGIWGRGCSHTIQVLMDARFRNGFLFEAAVRPLDTHATDFHLYANCLEIVSAHADKPLVAWCRAC